MESRAKYNMSFTSGGLLEKESLTFANAYFQTNSWDLASENIKEGNLFQYRTLVATNRILQELKSRFSYLNEDALNLIVSGFSNETQQILWFAICQKHAFIFDFMKEVVREKYFMGVSAQAFLLRLSDNGRTHHGKRGNSLRRDTRRRRCRKRWNFLFS